MNKMTVQMNNGRKAKTLGKFNYDKFIQLAQNSYNVKKYSRAVDNCRLAAGFAMNQDNIQGAAEAYQLWIKSLLKLKKQTDVKKTCCDARSKFGNHLDLVYYEYLSALEGNDYNRATKLGRGYLELASGLNPTENVIFIESLEKLDEVKNKINNMQKELSPSR